MAVFREKVEEFVGAEQKETGWGENRWKSVSGINKKYKIETLRFSEELGENNECKSQA